MKKTLFIAIAALIAACQPVDDSEYLASFQQPPAPGSSCHIDESMIVQLEQGDGYAVNVWCDDVTPTLYVSRGFPCAFDGPEIKAVVAFFEDALDIKIDVVQDEQWGDPWYGGIYLSPDPPPVPETEASGWAMHRWVAPFIMHSSKIDMRFCETQLLAHELGHAMGFTHSEHVDSCLNPNCKELVIRSSELATMKMLRANMTVQSPMN